MRFNAWSLERIRKGVKTLTSRRAAFPDDPDVAYVVGPLPWRFIRDDLWQDEGADSPGELQKVIDAICHHPVRDDEMFHVHVLRGTTKRS